MPIDPLGSGPIQFRPDAPSAPAALVSQTQKSLNILHGPGNLREDGVFDAPTQQAVREFQQARQLPPTGAIDQRTMDELTKAVQKQESGPGGEEPSVRASESEKQARLAELAIRDQAMRIKTGVQAGKGAIVVVTYGADSLKTEPSGKEIRKNQGAEPEAT